MGINIVHGTYISVHQFGANVRNGLELLQVKSDSKINDMGDDTSEERNTTSRRKTAILLWTERCWPSPKAQENENACWQISYDAKKFGATVIAAWLPETTCTFISFYKPKRTGFSLPYATFTNNISVELRVLHSELVAWAAQASICYRRCVSFVPTHLFTQYTNI